jgi:cytochrome P450
MARIAGLFRTLWIRLLIVVLGLAALGRLIGIALASLVGLSGTVASRLAARLTAADGQRIVCDVARAFLPNLVFARKLVAAYDNGGTALVTRFDDVKDVLRRDDDFEVVYGPRMMRITDGANFFLGMQDTPAYTRDVSNMRLAVRRDDVPVIVQPFAAQRAAALVGALPGRIDVPQDLTLRVPAQLLGAYFGTPGPSEPEMIAWTTIMFWYLFIDLAADPDLDTRALAAAASCRAYLDATIQARKAAPTEADDVLNRCLALQRAGMPGMDDTGIRDNLIGLVIGAVPTTSKAAVQALDQLLLRPDALAGAQRAARADDDALLARHVFEALRFNPVNPVIYRRATRDAVIAPNTLRAVSVPKSTMVLASNLSAMFDRLKVDDPTRFRVDRPWDNYILWGDGPHTCFGAHINQVLIPAILKPLLARRGLRRVAGDLGQIDTEGTPFPVHLWLEFEPG